jgi:hypothetical protein
MHCRIERDRALVKAGGGQSEPEEGHALQNRARRDILFSGWWPCTAERRKWGTLQNGGHVMGNGASCNMTQQHLMVAMHCRTGNMVEQGGALHSVEGGQCESEEGHALRNRARWSII